MCRSAEGHKEENRSVRPIIVRDCIQPGKFDIGSVDVRYFLSTRQSTDLNRSLWSKSREGARNNDNKTQINYKTTLSSSSNDNRSHSTNRLQYMNSWGAVVQLQYSRLQVWFLVASQQDLLSVILKTKILGFLSMWGRCLSTKTRLGYK